MTVAQPLLSHERERFIDDLIGYMTLEEKLGQLDLVHSAQDPGLEAAIAAGQVGGVAGADLPQRLQTLATEQSRLGIPLLIAASPPPLPLSPWALAASWDEDLAYQIGNSVAHDAARDGANCLLGPKLVIANEGPAIADALVATSQAHLAARLSEAFARGAARGDAGPCPRALAIIPMVGTDEATLRCSLDQAYRKAIQAIDCPALDRETALKADFAGLLPAECRRLTAILAQHFVTTSARSPIEAAEKVIASGLVGEHEIDSAVRGVLTVKHALDLFRRGVSSANPAPNDELPAGAELVRRSVVLLRNESGLLPFSPVSDRVLVVGTAEGAGGACADALSRAGIGHAIAPGLALRRVGESSTAPVAGDHFAQSLTRDAAQRADFVLVALEDRHFVERGSDRWRRPGRAVLNLLDALATTKSRLVALVAVDEPVDLAEADQHFSAVLQCWKPGPGFEEALADILSGRYSPQGRLPVTAGRFEFGHGLGYGESVFSTLALSEGADHILASVRVRNSGSFEARETVQIYVRAPDSALRLVGFEHVTLAPSEEVPVHFELGLAALGELGIDHRLELVPGPREILVGKNVGRLLSARLDVTPALARAVRRQRPDRLRLAVG